MEKGVTLDEREEWESLFWWMLSPKKVSNHRAATFGGLTKVPYINPLYSMHLHCFARCYSWTAILSASLFPSIHGQLCHPCVATCLPKLTISNSSKTKSVSNFRNWSAAFWPTCSALGCAAGSKARGAKDSHGSKFIQTWSLPDWHEEICFWLCIYSLPWRIFLGDGHSSHAKLERFELEATVRERGITAWCQTEKRNYFFLPSYIWSKLWNCFIFLSGENNTWRLMIWQAEHPDSRYTFREKLAIGLKLLAAANYGAFKYLFRLIISALISIIRTTLLVYTLGYNFMGKLFSWNESEGFEPLE